MNYRGSTRAPAIGDIVTFPSAVGEWLVEELPLKPDGELTLKGGLGAVQYCEARWCTFVRVASPADKRAFLTSRERAEREDYDA